MASMFEDRTVKPHLSNLDNVLFSHQDEENSSEILSSDMARVRPTTTSKHSRELNVNLINMRRRQVRRIISHRRGEEDIDNEIEEKEEEVKIQEQEVNSLSYVKNVFNIINCSYGQASLPQRPTFSLAQNLNDSEGITKSSCQSNSILHKKMVKEEDEFYENNKTCLLFPSFESLEAKLRDIFISSSNKKKEVSISSTSQCKSITKTTFKLKPNAMSIIRLVLVTLLYLSLSILVRSSIQEQVQYFEAQPEPIHLIQNGQDTRLRCLIRNRQGECLWLKNGRAIGSITRKYQYNRSPEDGDCSINIRNVSVQQDDGIWHCQVTAPDPEQDTLQSGGVQLIVLVAPEKPQIKNTTQAPTRMVLEENKVKIVTCEIKGGNPAPLIEWTLDGKNVTKEAQSSSSSNGNQRVTESRLRLSNIKRSMNGKNLTCYGIHQTSNQSTSVELDVQYAPTVSVIQREYSIVEGSPLSINCQVDANPPPNLINWRLVNDAAQGSRTSQSPSAISLPTRPGPVLEFERITRDLNQNVFECLAENSRGISLPADVKLNVLYAPYQVNTSNSESVLVGSDAQLACVFEGNPEPEVKWLYTDPLSRAASVVQLSEASTSVWAGQSSSASKQQASTSSTMNPSRSQQFLNIKNVTYRNEGDYHCEAKNRINGVSYSVRSSNIILDVFGEPQFLVKSPTNARAIRGSRSDVSLTFCSDPPPNKVFWQFGSIRLDVRLSNSTTGSNEASNSNSRSSFATLLFNQLGGHSSPSSGSSHKQSANQAGNNPAILQRFLVHPLQALQRRESSFSKVPTCFEAQLTLLDPEISDQRDYTLTVQNERGFQSSTIKLVVSSPLSPILIITSALVTICGLFLVSLLLLFLIRARQSMERESNGLTSGNGSSGSSSQQTILGQPTSKQRRNNDMKTSVEHLVNGSNPGNLVNGGANGNVNGGFNMQPGQTKGLVNGTGSGHANNASNLGSLQQPDGSVSSSGSQGSEEMKIHMLTSMASSDSSGDQRQLLTHLDHQRHSSISSPHSSVSPSSEHSSSTMMNVQTVDMNMNGASSLNSGASSTIIARRNSQRLRQRISIEDDGDLNDFECDFMGQQQQHHMGSNKENINQDDIMTGLNPAFDDGSTSSTYRAAESVTQGITRGLRPDLVRQTYENGALIYANIDYSQDPSNVSIANMLDIKRQNGNSKKLQDSPDLMHSPIDSNDRQVNVQLNPQINEYGTERMNNNNNINTSQININNNSNNNNINATRNTTTINKTQGPGTRSKVGATIAMMNSLAAAANNQQQQQQPIGAIRQHLANHRQPIVGTNGYGPSVKKQGPPKPPKPSIHQTGRLFQQATSGALKNSNDNGGLEILGAESQSAKNNHDDIAAEYSRLNFAERAEL